MLLWHGVQLKVVPLKALWSQRLWTALSVLQAVSCNLGMAVKTWQCGDMNNALPNPMNSRSLIVWMPCFPSVVGLYCCEDLDSDRVSPLM